MTYFLLLLGIFLTSPTHAADMLHGTLTQGGFAVFQVPVDSTVWLDDTRVNVTPDGKAGVGFARDAKPASTLKVCVEGLCDTTPLRIASRTYKIQNVVGVPPKTVTPNKADEKRIAADNIAIGSARAQTGALTAFADTFIPPVENAPTSGVFGSRRTYNGHERSWHKGLDFAAPTGTPIRAPANGVVTLARSTFMTGNLVMLDHGYGFSTLYAHMDTMAVKVGQHVQQGDTLGTIGTTGRSTGPHLHWGFYWRKIPLDPATLIGHNAATIRK